MSPDAPPADTEARSGPVLEGAGRAVVAASAGGLFAVVWLAFVCQLLALIASVATGVNGAWTWVKVGLLATVLSLGSQARASVDGARGLLSTSDLVIRLRFVPMLLTLGFLWLAGRAGRRAARERPGGSPLASSAMAAAGAGLPVAALAAIAAASVRLSFPSVGVDVTADPAIAALWGFAVAGAGAGTGAYLEAARGSFAAATLRSGLAGYGWALAALAVGVLLLATLEPSATRAYVGGLSGLGPGGAVVFGAHLLAFPAQSALLLVPAMGSCLDLVGNAGSGVTFCPWTVTGTGGFRFLSTNLSLSPWLLMFHVAPALGAVLAGMRALAASARRRTVALGVAAGAVFGGLSVGGAVFAAPRVSLPISVVWIPVDVRPSLPGAIAVAVLWGIAGGMLGAWLAVRRQEGPSPTSA